MTTFSKNKNLGLAVQQHLLEIGVETPMVQGMIEVDAAVKKAKMEGLFLQVFETLGMDMTNDSLAETPMRMAKMYVDEIFYGLDYSHFPKCTTVENHMQHAGIVLTKATVNSTCEHHAVVIYGIATVAYIPGNKVLGLSKLNRIVDFFARRPQIQERLTEQVYHALSFILETEDVAVTINAEHYCVKSRGIKDSNSDTTTSKLGGEFLKPTVRAEFFSLMNNTQKR